ncbi:MAG: hypothetical protein B7Z08_12610 [Sphingomonadales bacterium 32-68-7]|nr:MAG: hypothetical protein B7Z33_06355 [Sphingomonadales bacterium 12-68-11]OYX07313.1 MAG: hypothetical protein B7Z08_12610 [Sphingomonadales bacterium 32-68-7]
MCNCRFCRSLGAAWAYYRPDEVAITGETGTYRRDDIAEVWLIAHFCPTCGSTTHYTPTERGDPDEWGINSRLFALDELAGIAARFQDGRRVATADDTFVVTGTGHIGDGKAF